MGVLKTTIDQRVVRCEEKEQRLRAFIDTYLGRLAETAEPEPDECRAALIARSPGSPVARALSDLAEDLFLADVSLRIVFAHPEPHDQLNAWIEPGLSDLAEAAGGLQIRWPQSPALIEAHEQLVLGSTMCWSGDTMRRDPSKRDALELFESGDREAARRAIRAFEAMWALSKPMVIRRAASTGGAPAHGEAERDAREMTLQPCARHPSGATRH